MRTERQASPEPSHIIHPCPAGGPGLGGCGRGYRLAGADRLHHRPRRSARRCHGPKKRGGLPAGRTGRSRSRPIPRWTGHQDPPRLRWPRPPLLPEIARRRSSTRVVASKRTTPCFSTTAAMGAAPAGGCAYARAIPGGLGCRARCTQSKLLGREPLCRDSVSRTSRVACPQLARRLRLPFVYGSPKRTRITSSHGSSPSYK